MGLRCVLAGVVLPVEVRSRRHRGSRQSLSGEIRVSNLIGHHAKVVLDLATVRQLGSALLKQTESPLVDASLVEDPAQGVRDLRVLRDRLFGGLSELERLLLIPTVLGIEPGEVVSRYVE